MAATDLTDLTLAQMRDGLKAKSFSAVELTQAHISAVEAARELNAFIVETPELALEQARAADAAIAKGEAGPLAGIPLGIKDLFCTKGVQTTAASKILEGFVPTYESTVTANLFRDGAVMLGKLNLDQFAMGSSNETSAFGNVLNPYRGPSGEHLVPGGSSGGSSSAVAARLIAAATGTDTGGSIRQPAAVTGTVGVKPTYGGVSRYGMVAFSSSLDQGGPCARTVLDAALLHEAIAGHDPLDSTSIDAPVPPVVEAARNGSVEGMRVGVVKQFRGEGYQAGVVQRFDESVELLRKLGATVVELDCPSFDLALSAYYLIAPSECSSNLARFDAMRYGLRVGDDGTRSAEEVTAITREEGFGDEVKRRVILGTYALSSGYYDAYYGSAQKVRTLITRDFERAFEEVDVIVSPTTPTTAFPIGERADDPMAMYLADLCTIPTNLAGNAAMSLPCGLAPEDGLPVGLQIIAPAMKDDRLYKVGAAVEAAFVEQWGHPLLEEAPSL